MIAEWERQRCVLISFPHEETDWAKGDLTAALSPFIRIAQAIAYKEAVYIICQSKEQIIPLFCSTRNLTFIEIPTNDTWIRDYGYFSIEAKGETRLLDFTFDGWGGKFAAHLDNQVNRTLHQKGYMGTTPLDEIDFVLEGGSIESNGEGTLLTTSQCLCNPNRNGGLTKEEVEHRLKRYLGAKQVLWLDHGHLIGDDTDSHIDTLARFTDAQTIAYVKCEERDDPHYRTLAEMEAELKRFRQPSGEPYRLVPLPLCNPVYNHRGERLPATYTNFLITNDALLFPTYGDNQHDKIAEEAFRLLFPDREMIPINCLKLIEEGGSLHCSTMQVAYEEISR